MKMALSIAVMLALAPFVIVGFAVAFAFGGIVAGALLANDFVDRL